jgi:hypothetical protein
MKRCIGFIMFLTLTTACENSFADCTCEDWVNRGGYCVDYVKSRIPTFPAPKSVAEITVLKNRETSQVKEGDVAIFDLGKYWHVAYVEKVHLDHKGTATAIDVSEMNFGEQLTFEEYKNRWNTGSESEWKRAVCCGVTKNFEQRSMRKNIALTSNVHIWSPDTAAAHENSGRHGDDTFLEKVREAFNHLIQFTGRQL